MNKLTLLAILSLVILCGCATTVNMNNKFYGNSTKVGILMVVDSANVTKKGAQGLLDMAISSGRKYKDPLKSIEKNINPKENTKLFLERVLNSKNKKYEFIDFVYKPKDFENFNYTSNESEYYFKKDLRALKNKLNVDELMFVNVNYGIMIDYYGAIEIGKQGYNATTISVVDLNDNKILFQDNVTSTENLKGKWNVAPFENMQNTINKANQKSIETLNTKFKN